MNPGREKGCRSRSDRNPLEVVGESQEDNRQWWEAHPMTYEGWEGDRRLAYSEDDPRFYREIDSTFFAGARHFSVAHGDDKPFSSLIDFPHMKGRRVLEIGCGQGSHAELFARAGAQYTGVDITTVAVRRTLKRFRLNGLTGSILQMDAERTPFPDESFDYVWSWGVIHHSHDPQAIVNEIHRVLVPGGRVHLMVYHKNSLRYYLRGGVREGLLRGKLLRMSLYEVNMRFTDGAIAHHYTRAGASRMFERFSQVHTSVLDGETEAYIPLIGASARRLTPRFMKRLDASLQRRFGWFLCIDATK